MNLVWRINLRFSNICCHSVLKRWQVFEMKNNSKAGLDIFTKVTIRRSQNIIFLIFGNISEFNSFIFIYLNIQYMIIYIILYYIVLFIKLLFCAELYTQTHSRLLDDGQKKF